MQALKNETLNKRLVEAIKRVKYGDDYEEEKTDLKKLTILNKKIKFGRNCYSLAFQSS